MQEIGIAALTSDRQSLIFEDDSETTDRVSYYTMALADGTISGPIFEREDADVEALLVDINRIAYGVVYSGLTPTYEFFDEKMTARMLAIQARFHGNAVGWPMPAPIAVTSSFASQAATLPATTTCFPTTAS